MPGFPVAAWLRRLAAGEALRAYRVLRVGHGDAYLVRRRYLSDGTIVELTGGIDADEGDERTVGRWTDLDVETRRLAATGWDVSG